MSETRDKKDGNWRAAATLLGVDPNEPDDFKYWSEMDRKMAIIDSFRYHQPNAEQVDRIAHVRQGHIVLAQLIMRSTMTGPDQTAALRKLHECMMTVNKAIVTETP